MSETTSLVLLGRKFEGFDRALTAQLRQLPEAEPEVQAIAPYYAVLEEAHAHARSVPVDPRWPQMAAILNEMMRAVVSDAAGQQALDLAHRELGVLLDRTAEAN